LGGKKEGTLGTLTRSTETTERTRVRGDILVVFAFELLDEMVNGTAVEVFTSKVVITSSGFDLKDTLFDGQKRDTDKSTSKIEIRMFC